METSDQAPLCGDRFSFGPFELSAAQRRLTCRGEPLRLGARAFDLLAALVERAGLPVTKERLVALVWPHRLVEESNLRVHIAALRKLFAQHAGAEHFIVNIAGLGYVFSAPVARSQSVAADRPISGLFGREGEIAAILEGMGERRLVTLAGPAGVGKTAVAEAIRAQSGTAAWVDLSLVETAAQLPGAIARALEIDRQADLGAALAGRVLTLVLDSCDHLLEPVAALAERLLRAAPGLTLLATSREPLACREEWVLRLAPLAVPVAAPGLTAAQALASPAVQLFVARARSYSGDFLFGDEQAGPVAALCARRDGVPLAIELVASRLDLLGLGQTGGDLEERLMLSVRRGAGRQASMRAALDWSYDRLSPMEQQVLQRLSACRGGFTLRAAVEMAAHGAVSQGDVLDALASLTARSLIATQAGGAAPLYRLFHVTRAYAAEKLEAAQVVNPGPSPLKLAALPFGFALPLPEVAGQGLPLREGRSRRAGERHESWPARFS